MKRITRSLCLGAVALAFALPMQAQDNKCSQDIHGLLGETQARSAEVLKKCAERQGVSVSGTPVLLAAEGSSAAIIPAEGVADLKREDLKDWKTLGVFSAQGPEGADAPSGTFTLRAQADVGSDKGRFQVVDAHGKVVQEGEIDIEVAPEGEGAAAKGVPQLFAPPAAGMPPGKPGADNKAFYGYPCHYYPFYYYPFYIHPYYYYGCHYWVYSWPWGHIRLRYCWWPWYYYYPCWWYGHCWW